MAALAKLPDGYYYCGRDGETCMDHLGNWYRMVPATPAPAQTPKTKPPAPIHLSELARAQIAAMMPELASMGSEHTVWCVVDGTGNLLEAFSTSSGHDDTDESDHRLSIERVVKTPKRAGLFLLHNHPRLPEGGGDNKPSAKDHTFTQWVKDRLKPFDVQLIDHQIIGARATESRSIEAKDEPVEPLGRTPEWEASIERAVKRLEARIGVTSQTTEAPAPVELYESEMDYASDWHRRQAQLEYQQAHEPAWLQQIKESTRRRYAR